MLARRAVLLAFAALGGGMRWARAEPAALAPDLKRILERGRLIVATAGFALPPFVMTDADGKPQGTDIELAGGIAEALGVAVAFDRRARSSDEIIAILLRHEADLAIARLSETLAAAMRIRFSRPYLVLSEALLLSRPRFARLAAGREPLALAQEPGAEIAVEAGTAYLDYARRLLPRARIRRFASWEEAVGAVLKGDVLAAYGDELAVRHTLAARPEAPLQLRAAILADERDRIGIALPWDSPQLRAWVDLYLETAAEPLTVAGLLARYPAATASGPGGEK